MTKETTILAIQSYILIFYQLDPFPSFSGQRDHGQESLINGDVHTKSSKKKSKFKKSYLVIYYGEILLEFKEIIIFFMKIQNNIWPFC